MEKKWFIRAAQAAVITIAMAAVCQEMEKPREERKWHGKIAAFIPYDLRTPTVDKFREAYWNPYERRVFTPEVFGIGWAVNLYRLLENLGIIREDVSEESFLMPTPSIRDVLEQAQMAE